MKDDLVNFTKWNEESEGKWRGRRSGKQEWRWKKGEAGSSAWGGYNALFTFFFNCMPPTLRGSHAHIVPTYPTHIPYTLSFIFCLALRSHSRHKHRTGTLKSSIHITGDIRNTLQHSTSPLPYIFFSKKISYSKSSMHLTDEIWHALCTIWFSSFLQQQQLQWVSKLHNTYSNLKGSHIQRRRTCCTSH